MKTGNDSGGAVAAVAEECRKEAMVETRAFVLELDGIVQRLKGSSCRSRERAMGIVKLQEAIMWLGMDLKELGAPDAKVLAEGV